MTSFSRADVRTYIRICVFAARASLRATYKSMSELASSQGTNSTLKDAATSRTARRGLP